MDPIAPEVRGYLDELVPARPTELVRMEEHAREIGFPIVGPASGLLCYQISRMIGARSVFELGSGFGYSTAWFARAVNMLWSGRIFDDADRSEDTEGVRRFTGMITADRGWTVSLVPIRDGLIVAYRNPS